MNVQTVSPHSFVVYITSDELSLKNILPQDVTAAVLADILSPLTEGASVKMDVFPGKDGVLIFLHKYDCAASFFAFGDFEYLLQAIKCCPRDIPSSLYFADGKYVMTIRCGDDIAHCLSEFADEENFSPEYISFLEEHGKVLIPAGAVLRIAALFDK